jgi:hypothetical protein
MTFGRTSRTKFLNGDGMTIRKTTTDAVLRANQENGNKTPGPTNTSRTKDNARTHGFLASTIKFVDETQEKEHAELLDKLVKHRRPNGPEEQIEVEMMAIELLRLRDLYGAEFAEHQRRTNAAALQVVTDNGFTREAALEAATEQGYQIEALLWRSGPQVRSEGEGFDELVHDTRNIVVSAKLANRSDLIDRYKTKHLRTYHAALAVLQGLQRERAQQEELQASDEDTEAKNEE